jgi:hypothetical protein
VRGDVVTDGPFIEAKEVVAGFYVLEAPDLDVALRIAKLNPATTSPRSACRRRTSPR